MKRLLTAAVIAALPLAAHAANVYDGVAGTATETEQYGTSSGGPSFSTSQTTVSTTNENLSSTVEFSPLTTFSSFNFWLAPQSTCSGGGCSGSSTTGTETDTITVTFTGVTVNGHTVPTFQETGTFTADYKSTDTILPCAIGDGKSGNKNGAANSVGQSDCFVWTGAANTWNGSAPLFEPISGMPGDDLEIMFFNATDWNVNPSFRVAVVDAPVPEPASIALLGAGLLGTIAFTRRRRA